MLSFLISIVTLTGMIGILALFLGKSTKINLLGPGTVRFGKWFAGLSLTLLVFFIPLSMVFSLFETPDEDLDSSRVPILPATNDGPNYNKPALDENQRREQEEERLLKTLKYATSVKIEGETVEVIFNFPTDGDLYTAPRISGYYQGGYGSLTGNPYIYSANGSPPGTIIPGSKTLQWSDRTVYEALYGALEDGQVCEILITYKMVRHKTF